MDLVALGEKNSDYMFRATHIKAREKKFGYIMPLKEWTKGDVVSYLKYRKIPLPEMAHSVSGSAVDLTAESILWMHDCSRADYEHVRKYFPEIEAVVLRRELYGIGKTFKAKEATGGDATGEPAPGDTKPVASPVEAG